MALDSLGEGTPFPSLFINTISAENYIQFLLKII